MRLIKNHFSNLLLREASNSQLSTQKGFTLVELLIYMGVLTMLIGVMSVLLGSILGVQSDSAGTSGVDIDSRYILAKLAYDFESNYPVVIKTPASSASPSQNLVININNNVVDTSYSINGSDNLVVSNSQGTYALNSSDTKVSNLSITRLGAGVYKDTVRLTFTVSSRIQTSKGYESRTVQSTFAGNREN